MEYRVLGKVEVLRGDEAVDLGAFRQRALLALLLTSPNAVVSTDQLIDGLWGDDGSADRQNSLWVYVSGLRKALEPDREKRSDGEILLTRAPGYLLHAEPEQIDSVRFERLVTEGKALARTDPGAASVVLGEALALWRGRAFEDFTYESFAQAEIARLEGLRLVAVEARIDADLDRGMSRELVSELETLVRQHPLQERLTGQLMLALYRAGRQADALRSYQLLKAHLGDELGIEPSNAIRRLEEQIITGDDALDADARGSLPGAGPVAGLVVRGYELREKIGEGEFGVAYRAYQPAVGREVALKIIRPELANDPDFIRRFEAEAHVVAKLEHPHIVPLYDYWREPDAAYLAMRLMKGGSLADLFETSALTTDRANRVLDQLGSALRAAHRSGVVHRDIRADNILFDDEGNAYLSDFGIAFGADADTSHAGSLTATVHPQFASPEAHERGEVTAASDVYSLGVVMAHAITGLSGEIVQIRGALPPPALRVIDRATARDVDDRYGDISSFVTDMHKALGDVEPAEVEPDIELENPYKGLRSFDAADTDDFFGRERLVDRLVARLGELGSRGRFVAVVGPSGSGKSSVVKAGLLPALRRGAVPLSENWFIVTMTPGPHPFEELEDALLGIAVHPPTSLLEHIAGENGLHRSLRRLMPEDGSQLLLVIDQFEELFTQVDAYTARAFLDVLASAVNDEHSRVRVVVTLRADFYDRPLRHRGVGELLRDGTEAITPMTPEELERAIAGPVEPLGITHEPALVAELVRDVVDRSGALPLLQYALTELFDARQGQRITDAAYRDLGGVSGALVERAEGLLAQLGEHAHEVTRQVFLRLVTLGEGADDTRRRVLRSELEQLAVDRELLAGVLDTFGRHRLLSFDRDPVTRGPTVEISHEALLTEWTRLGAWIDGARDDVRAQRRLAEAMAEWEAADQENAYLLRGGRLAQLHGWATTTSLRLSATELAFLEASVGEREREVREEQEREQMRSIAEASASRRLKLTAAAGAVALVVGALAVVTFLQARAAQQSEDELAATLRSQDLAASSVVQLRTDLDLAALLALEAAKATSEFGVVTPEATDALHWVLQEADIEYPADETSSVAVRPGPDGAAGVFVLPPAELAGLVSGVATEPLNAAQCAEYDIDPCGPPQALATDVVIQGGDEAYGSVQPGPGALAGTSVEVLSAFGADEGYARELERFEEVTGIVVSAPGFENPGFELDRRPADLEALPDLMFWAQPAQLTSFDTAMVDLSSYLDVEQLRDDVGPRLLSLGTVGPNGEWPAESGELRGLPTDVDIKGLVFYPRQRFEEAGYDIPQSWDELISLSDEMVADGRTPWCFHFESGGGSGWPGTDLIETLLIRDGGVEVYDQWTRHEIPFDHPAALTAARRTEQLLLTDAYVRGGTASISRFSFFTEGVTPLLTPEPECWLYHQSDFVGNFVPPTAVLGKDIDVFPFPPIQAGDPLPATGGGNVLSAFSDRPEVREFIRYAAEPTWGEKWAQHPTSFISPNQRFDVSAYGGESGVGRTTFRQTIGIIARDAIAADTFRFDASDLMPSAIGSGSDGIPGAFWVGMLDVVDGGRTMSQVMSDIEAAWAALEAEGGT